MFIAARLAKFAQFLVAKDWDGDETPPGYVPPLGVDQVWQDETENRAADVPYQNTTGRAIAVSVQLEVDSEHDPALVTLQVSPDGVTWSTIGVADNTNGTFAFGIVPDGHYYQAETIFGTAVFWNWIELKEAA